MPLVRRRGEGWALAEDGWVHVEAGAPVPPGDAIVGWARYLEEREALWARAGRLGVRVPPGVEVPLLGAASPALAVVAVEFPKFVDGRGYSIARLLRDRYGYRGELRAVGQVLRDQLAMMARCGFDAFELAAGKSAEDALDAFAEIPVAYQPAADERLPLWKRHARPAP